MHNKLLKYSFLFLYIFLLFACSHSAKVVSIETAIIKLNGSKTPLEDAKVVEEIAPYKASMEKEMGDVLGYSEHEMTKRLPEGLLGNFIADLILKKANDFLVSQDITDNLEIDFCLLNNGGLRAAMPKGEITKRKIFEIMPFENKLVILTLSGKKTKELFNSLARRGGGPISGAKMEINNNYAINIIVNDEPFNINKNYRVVTSDYLANGGDNMRYFSNPIGYKILEHYLVRDAIIEFVIEENKKGNKLKSQLDRRIFYTK